MYSSPKEVIKIENKQIQKETDSEQLVCFTNWYWWTLNEKDNIIMYHEVFF